MLRKISDYIIPSECIIKGDPATLQGIEKQFQIKKPISISFLNGSPVFFPKLPFSEHDILAAFKRVIKNKFAYSPDRFNKILEIKSKLFYIFIQRQDLVNYALSKLEKQCADLLKTYDMNTLSLADKNLHPQAYIKQITRKIDNNKSCFYYNYFPILNKASINCTSSLRGILRNILLEVLLKQLQKNNINTSINSRHFQYLLDKSYMYEFAGVVEVKGALDYLRAGMMFIDCHELPDEDNRFHGVSSHLVQEFIISVLLEEGYLGDREVKNEKPITEKELLKFESMILASKPEMYTLFDLMREYNLSKLLMLKLYDLDSKEDNLNLTAGLTTPDGVNEYIMLNHAYFPCLSAILYTQYAYGTMQYFSLNNFNNKPLEITIVDANKHTYKKFTELTEEEKIYFINCYYNDVDLTLNNILPANMEEYNVIKKYENKGEIQAAVLMAKRDKPSISQTDNDSAPYQLVKRTPYFFLPSRSETNRFSHECSPKKPLFRRH